MVQTKLFSDLYLTKFLDISAKPFFPNEKIAKYNGRLNNISSIFHLSI